MNTITKRLVLFLPAITFVLASSAVVGAALGSGILHPYRKPVTAETLPRPIARSPRFTPHAPISRSQRLMARNFADGKFAPKVPNGDWVVILHGVADNRCGQIGYAKFMLARGFGDVMMDSRAQGESGGGWRLTAGWNETTRKSIDDALWRPSRCAISSTSANPWALPSLYNRPP